MPDVEQSPDGPLEDSGQYLVFFRALRMRAEAMGAPDPDGAAQDTLVAAWNDAAAGPTMRFRALATLPAAGMDAVWPLGVFYAWLIKTLRRIVVRQLRKNSRLLSIDGTERNGMGEFADKSKDTERNFADREVELALEDCISCLPEPYRSVIDLQRRGWKYQQIAAKFEVPVNTAATWRARALQDLVACMKRKRMLP